MNSFKSQNQRHYPSKNNKKRRLTQEQVRQLESSFSSNSRLDPERKLQLAHQLDIPPRQIAIWYQNKRARWKNQTLELDYTAIHMRLENALSQKRQLEKEVQRLRMELHKSQEINALKQVQMIVQPQVPQQHPLVSVSSLSSNCDEVGSSSLHDHDQLNNCSSWMNDDHDHVLRDDDLYAFLLGTNGSNFN